MRREMKNSGTATKRHKKHKDLLVPFVPFCGCPRIFLERHASDNLAGARARAAHSCRTAADEVHVSITTRQLSCTVSRREGARIDVEGPANAWSLQEQPVEHILELR